MDSLKISVLVVAAALLLSHCAASDDTPGPAPGMTKVGELDIEVHRPGPTSVTPSLSPDPSPGQEDDHGDDDDADGDDGHDGLHHLSDGELRDASDLLCEGAAQWWRSAASSDLDRWRARGLDNDYISHFTADAYTEVMFGALQEANWDEFDTTVHVFPEYSSAACVFSRPTQSKGRLETTTLTFLTVDSPVVAGTMLHERSTTAFAAEEAARKSFKR